MKKLAILFVCLGVVGCNDYKIQYDCSEVPPEKLVVMKDIFTACVHAGQSSCQSFITQSFCKPYILPTESEDMENFELFMKNHAELFSAIKEAQEKVNSFKEAHPVTPLPK